MTIPKPGDVIYVDSELYVWHGVDDFRGGKATISAVQIQGSGDEQGARVEIKEHPGHSYSSTSLAERQSMLAAKFGDAWAHPEPDFRPEFNNDSEGW
jgi:hypothetical protein